MRSKGGGTGGGGGGKAKTNKSRTEKSQGDDRRASGSSAAADNRGGSETCVEDGTHVWPVAAAGLRELPGHVAVVDKVAVLSGMYVSDQMDWPFEAVLLLHALAHLALQNYAVYRSHVLDIDVCAVVYCVVALLRRPAWKHLQASYHAYLLHGCRLPIACLPASLLNSAAVQPSALFAHAFSNLVHTKEGPLLCNHSPLADKFKANAASAADLSSLDLNGRTADGTGEPQRPVAPEAVLYRLAASGVLFASIIVASIWTAVLLALKTDSRASPVRMLLLLTPALLYCGTPGRLSKCLPEQTLHLHCQRAKGHGGVSEHPQVVFISERSFPQLLKGVLYTSVTTALYAGVFPVAFVSNEHLYWHPHRTRLLTFVVFINTLLLLVARTTHLRVRELVAAANTHGAWRCCSSAAASDAAAAAATAAVPAGTAVPAAAAAAAAAVAGAGGGPAPVWRPGTLYKEGSLVRFHPGLVPSHNKTDASSVKVDETILQQASVYCGSAFRNGGIPGDLNMLLAWKMFSAPFKTQAFFTLGHLIVSLALLVVSLYSVTWCPACIMVAVTYVLLFLNLETKRATKHDARLRSLLRHVSAASPKNTASGSGPQRSQSGSGKGAGC
eukprot:Rhum_TRINITY_DN915_c0_g1::Rhum_TRINITY_DN915_c0_g1_i1::g.2727::m.2727